MKEVDEGREELTVGMGETNSLTTKSYDSKRGSIGLALEERIAKHGSLASIGRLSVNLVHDLNNPLDGVLRYIRLLLDQMPVDDPRRTYAENARDGLVKALSMIRGILDFARRSMSNPKTTNIEHSIGDICLLFREQISEQKIEVETEFGPDIPAVVDADLEQVFMNIVKNAIQAMPGGGMLYVKAKMSTPELFEITFKDTGPGIPKESQEKIFDPFFTTKDFGHCAGLGLPISREIIESHKGSIDVESEVGKGTAFTVRLPMGRAGIPVDD